MSSHIINNFNRSKTTSPPNMATAPTYVGRESSHSPESDGGYGTSLNSTTTPTDFSLSELVRAMRLRSNSDFGERVHSLPQPSPPSFPFRQDPPSLLPSGPALLAQLLGSTFQPPSPSFQGDGPGELERMAAQYRQAAR